MLFSAASLDELFAVSTSFSKSCLGQHPIHTTCKLSDRNVGCTIDAVPEHGSKMYLNLCQIQKQCQEPKIEIHCRPARQALSCIAANPYKNTSHRPRLSFQACLASPFGISCVPNSTLLYPKYIAGLLGKPCARFLRNPSKNVPQILRSPDTFQVC